MKKFLSLYKPYMIRPALYRCATKCAAALTLVLLWDRFLNRGPLTVPRDGCMVAGVVLLAAAWFGYLRLDGLRVHHLLEDRHKKKKKRRSTGDIADYVDEHIVSFDELNDEEQIACGLASSLLAAAPFLLTSLIAWIL